MLWIKDVELVDSVDDLKSSCSVRGFQMPNFEVLAAKIASALNRIIHNTHFKRRVSLEEQESSQRRPLPPRKTDSFTLIYEYFRVTGANDSLEKLYRPFLQLFFEMGRNSVINDENSTWWHLGRIVQTENTRVWETQDRNGLVQCGDSSEESWTWSSQIEDNGEKKYRAESTN